MMLPTRHILLPVLVISSCLGSTRADCDPVEEGQPLNLTCPVFHSISDSYRMRMRWETEPYRSIGSCVGTYCSSRRGGDFTVALDLASYLTILTIHNVSRISPFDMETGWRCYIFTAYERETVTPCAKLEIYALPELPECTVTEAPASSGPPSVNISCSSNKVYPQAQCRFDLLKHGENPTRLELPVVYTHVETGERPTYYTSQCSVSVPQAHLGDGPHVFQAYIYPAVTGGEHLVEAITMVWDSSAASPTTGIPVTDVDHSMEMLENSSGDGDSSDITAIVVGVIAVVIIAVLVSAIVVLVYRNRRQKTKQDFQRGVALHTAKPDEAEERPYEELPDKTMGADYCNTGPTVQDRNGTGPTVQDRNGTGPTVQDRNGTGPTRYGLYDRASAQDEEPDNLYEGLGADGDQGGPNGTM